MKKIMVIEELMLLLCNYAYKIGKHDEMFKTGFNEETYRKEWLNKIRTNLAHIVDEPEEECKPKQKIKHLNSFREYSDGDCDFDIGEIEDKVNEIIDLLNKE